MTFTVGTITACRAGAGNKHYSIPLVVAGQAYTIETTADEIVDAAPDDVREKRDAILARLRSTALEANANTLVELNAAVATKTFKV